MIKIGQSDRFSYPVKVDLPADGGKHTTYTFDAVFRRLDREQFQRIVTRAQAGELDDVDLARDVLLGWAGVMDEDDKPLPFSEEAREALLNVWPVLPAVIGAFMEAHTPKGRTKN